MEYHQWQAVVPSEQADALAEAFVVVDFHAFSCSSRVDGDVDVVWWTDQPTLPDAVASVLADAQVPFTTHGKSTEQELLAPYLPDQPHQLAPDVWIDPRSDDTAATWPPIDGLVLRLPPSSAFGDGLHPSTRMAARLVQQAIPEGRRVIDVGCGTGILGLLAAKLGAIAVSFSDIDDAAVLATKLACTLNGVMPERLARGHLLNVFADLPSVDLVLANLYADLVEDLLREPRLRELLPRGQLVLSGISRTKVDRVMTALTDSGFTVIEHLDDAWWDALLAVR